MTRKEQLVQKISENQKQLESLKSKKENLEINIQRLEAKIRNQEFQLSHIKKDTEVPNKDQTNVEGSSNIEDLILKS